jgi:hypothetical protein
MNKVKDQEQVPFQVAIVGFGPKGLYALERIIAELQHINCSKPLKIHLFNRTSFFGSGDVYRSDQPLSLLMNYSNHNIQFKHQKAPFLKTNTFQDFLPWLAENTNQKTEKLQYKYAPRAVVGSFLEYCFQSLLKLLPQHVEIKTHIASVIDVIPIKEKYEIVTQGGKNPPIKVDNILFTTGHFWNRQQIKPSKKTSSYIDFIYPVTKQFSGIPSTATVGIKGMGLTFIDAVLALTENTNSLSDSASVKNMCKIIPFSRSGVPMIPRTGEPDRDRELKFFTEQKLSPFINGKKTDFEKDLLPLLKQEYTYAYYETAFKINGFSIEDFENYTDLEKQITLFHQTHPEVEKWNWDKVFFPFSALKELTHDHVCDYIEQMCKEASLGKGTSPLMEAIAVWRKVSPLFNKIYSFGGLTAESQEKFDRYYFGVFNRLSYGPPVENMDKILTLVRNKTIDFSYARSPEIETLEGEKAYKIVNPTSSTTIDFLINATIPRAAGKKEKAGLYKNLVQRELVTEFVNTSKGKYCTGSVNINKKGNVLDVNGRVQPNLSCYGTPTEGITFDNDTLSNSRNNFSEYWAKSIIKQIAN